MCRAGGCFRSSALNLAQIHIWDISCSAISSLFQFSCAFPEVLVLPGANPPTHRREFRHVHGRSRTLADGFSGARAICCFLTVRF
jgi:hypothetical protein